MTFMNPSDELVKTMREFIRYWSHCTRVGMNRDCPELKPRWIEEMQELCPDGLVEHAINDLHAGVRATAIPEPTRGEAETIVNNIAYELHKERCVDIGLHNAVSELINCLRQLKVKP